MDYYYSSSQNVFSRGRFSSRGSSSYRGSGRGESSYRGSRGNGSYSSSRGYSSPRGRGNYYPKYESSAPKYNSDSGSRYTSHSRLDDNSYRKTDSSYSSSRDHSHHRSDVDVGRKRIRGDSYSQSQGSTSGRRSHEVDDYRSGGSRYTNSNSYSDSRSYSDNRGVFKKPRLSDFKSKDEYRGRKEISRSSVTMSKLRSYRGRSIRGRAVLRRGGDSFITRKRSVFSGSKTTSELLALRRSKLLRLRRLRAKRLSEEKAVSNDKQKDNGKSENEEDDDGEETVVKKESKETEEKSESRKEKDKEKEKEKEKKEEGEICDNDSESKEKDKSKKLEERLEFFKKSFIKLQCPQCSTKCVTFKEYMQHLFQPVHIKAMKEKSEQLKQTLAKMRIAQRAKQKKMDEEDVTNMNTRSIFCPICKLNYSQDKSTHQSSDAHKKLKKFLLPYCKICRIPYKSPMAYEKHICSLEHMRKKNALDERLGKTKGSSLEYLDNFMVLDSVGSGDEGEEFKDEKSEGEVKKEKTEKKSEEDLNVGEEFIRKVEAYYCEVCRTYLPRLSDHEKALRNHCRAKYHLKSYLRFGSEDLLKQIQGKKKRGSGEKSEGKKEVKQEDGIKENENHEDTTEDEVKLWADVSDLLSQVEPETKSDDEDDEESGRFDRFRSNEKKENGEVGSSEEGLVENEKYGIDGEEVKPAVKEAV